MYTIAIYSSIKGKHEPKLTFTLFSDLSDLRFLFLLLKDLASARQIFISFNMEQKLRIKLTY